MSGRSEEVKEGGDRRKGRGFLGVLFPVANALYGQMRGYGRWRIRREVRDAAYGSREELAEVRDELLPRRVRDAIERFPAYADRVSAHCGTAPAPGDSARLEDLPVWTREDQNALFDGLKGPPVRGAFVHQTGGSTGQPTRFYVTRESYEWRTAVSDYGYSLAGAEEGARSFYVWGSPIKNPGAMVRAKSGVHHWAQGRHYFDSFQFDDERKAACCREIDDYQPRAVVGYAGNLVELARYLRDNPRGLEWRARAVVTAAEALHSGQRELIEEQLADEVFLSYGSREFMMIGMECWQHNGYHLVGTNLLVEVVDESGHPTAPGETGRILVTDLCNDANPFIRYEIGDLGAMAHEDNPCPCGLPFPLLQRVDGRTQEVVINANGDRLTALFIPHLMKEFPWIDGYQVQQKAPGIIDVHLITQTDLSETLTAPITDALRSKLGTHMTITYQRVPSLTKSPSGKTPIVVPRGE